MRKLVALGLVMALAGVGCGSAASPAPEASPTPAASSSAEASAPPSSAGGGRWEQPIVIGWTPPDITGVFKTATDFFEKAAADAGQHGFNVQIVSRSPATHTAFADQLAILEDFISQKVDAIAISPADTEAVKPGIQAANAAGIPVIMVNLLEEQSGVEIASYIGFDNTQAAQVSAYTVLDLFGGPGVLGAGEQVTVTPEDYLDLGWWEELYSGVDPNLPKANGVIIEGIAGTFFSQARLDGFNGVIEKYPNVRILAEPCAADWNRQKGIACAENFYSRFEPSELNFVWAASNEMGLGAMLTAERENILNTNGAGEPAADKVSIFTNDGTPESVDAIRAGKLIAETWHGFPEWGWFGTEFAVRIACGLEVPKLQDIRPRTEYQANADQFYPNPQLPAIDWEGIKAQCQ
ncbi:MAG TPA: sugar ABC transporter substrate-binding protein [Candidatus Limnocylindrales bacterium]|nr:sugar ABC transporter substrate-binding protein [Candidatus Limnocylindrales bacterium]